MLPPNRQSFQKYETITMSPDTRQAALAQVQATAEAALSGAGLSAADGWLVDFPRGVFVRALVPATWAPAALTPTPTP